MSTTALHKKPIGSAEHPSIRRGGSRAVYRSLIRESEEVPGTVDELAAASSRAFLKEQLAAASQLPSDLPDDIRSLPAWLEESSGRAARDYQEYLDGRRAGAPRRYFTTKSHALYFLKAVAPTKLVDGAWLFGLLGRWRDPAYAPLIRIYLEELGDGCVDKNHVVLFRKLIAAHGCDNPDGLADGFFTQGAIQLALAHHADEFLPETIGFNFGYEQLPLHLLITAYELAELGIDPYYFTLHVTVDNASTGHARKSLEGIMQTLPRLGDPQAFQRRIVDGFKLNELGVGTCEAIASFDLEKELRSVLARKAPFGAQLHSDYCRIAGKTVNEWLSEPERMPEFLKALESGGWIKRGRDPRESRFWQLLQGERAPMFGVFSSYEQQLIHDWIDGGSDGSSRGDEPAAPRHPARFRFRAADSEDVGERAGPEALPGGATAAEVVESHFAAATMGATGDFASELHSLRDRLRSASDGEHVMSRLVPWMSPANHSTPAGLAATRLFADLFARLA